MNLSLEQEFSNAEIVKEVSKLKSKIDDLRPLSTDIEGKVMQKLRLDWNYNSNAIEGNKLNYGETVAFLMEGITAKGKPLKDHLDIRGHNEAILFLMSIIKDKRLLTESDIRGLHEMILVEPYTVQAQTEDGKQTSKIITLGEYKTMPNHVKTVTGEIHYYSTPQETPIKMQELMNWYNKAISQEDIHPLVIAALFHHKFVAIHPFDDGNGRLSRILMNLILMQHEYPPVVIKMDDRKNYYSLLSRADTGDNWPFIEYIAENMLNSLNLYLKAAQGGDIDEDDDIDKEIALFRGQIHDQVTIKKVKDYEAVKEVIIQEINPLFNKISKTIRPFNDDFLNHSTSFMASIDSTERNVRVHSMDENFLERIKVNFSRWSIIEYFTQFIQFKNSKNDFNVAASIHLEFEKYEYKIYGTKGNLILTKLYHDKITDQDYKLIIRDLVDSLKTQMQQHLNDKSPKP